MKNFYLKKITFLLFIQQIICLNLFAKSLNQSNYCTVTGSSGTHGYISNVTLNTINRNSTFDGFVSTVNSTNVERDMYFELKVSVYNNGANLFSAAWIDFNNDGDFNDTGENVLTSSLHSNSIGTTERVRIIKIPLNAALGTTKMRVVAKYNSNLSGPCDSYSNNIDWEEYDITLINRTSMVFTSCSVSQQNDSLLYPCSSNNKIIRIDVMTTGSVNPIKITSLTLSTLGTNNPTDNIENARLYLTTFYNGNPYTLLYGNVVVSPDGTFVINDNFKSLSAGINYLWLLYDIKTSANCNDSVDAQCLSVTAGGVTKNTDNAAISGSRPIFCGQFYYSKGNLPVNNLSSWSSTVDGTGTYPNSFNSENIFIVQNGDSMFTESTITIDKLYIDGGYVLGNHLVTLKILLIMNNGFYHQKFSATNGNYIENFIIEDGGTWIHDNNAYLPSRTRKFSPNSNQWFYQYGGGTFPIDTKWGNVLLKSVTVGNFNISNSLNSIQGDFEWQQTGDSFSYLTSGNSETFNIGGNLVFSGGQYKGHSYVSGGAKIITFNIGKNFIINDGYFSDFITAANNSKMNINICGEFIQTGGVFNINSDTTRCKTTMNIANNCPSCNFTPSSISITANKTIICSGENVVFTTSTINTGTNPTYEWKLNGNVVGNNSSNYSNSTLNNGDIISCNVTTNDSCSTSNSATSNSVYIYVNIINKNITISNSTLTATQVGATYKWLDCNANTIISGETNGTFTPTNSGNYACIITLGSCTDTTNCLNVTISGLSNTISNKNIFEIYPNPIKQNIGLKIKSDIEKMAIIEINNSVGQLVYKSTLNFETSKEVVLEDLKLNSGTYIINLITEKESVINKLIIH